MSLYGCVEAGGTKFVLGVVDADRRVIARARLPTTSPRETLGAALAFFREAGGPCAAFGLASFGPLVLDRASPHWGTLAQTPKPGWSGVDLVTPFAEGFGAPVALDTDVNGAALAESLWGAARDAGVATYVTVGTGIGGGAVVDGRPLHGARHPEMGHAFPARHPDDADFAGICPFHGACFEGLASGPAIAARWGASLSDLPGDHPAHGIVAFYLGQLVVAQQALLAPRRIVLGGGVLQTPGLLEHVRREAERLAGGYFGAVDYDALVVAPGLGTDAGLMGALALALSAGARAA